MQPLPPPRRLNEIQFFKMSSALEADGNLRCRNWKSQRGKMYPWLFFPPDKHAIWILLATPGHILCICYEDLDIFACSALRDRDESGAFVLGFYSKLTCPGGRGSGTHFWQEKSRNIE